MEQRVKLKNLIKKCQYTKQELHKLRTVLKSNINMKAENCQEPILTNKKIKANSLMESSLIHLKNYKENAHIENNSYRLPFIQSGNTSVHMNQSKSFERSHSKEKHKKIYRLQNCPRETNKEQDSDPLPKISNAINQHYRPRNASLNQSEIYEKMIAGKNHKKQNKQNKGLGHLSYLKEQAKEKDKADDKVEEFRLGILKKISHENIRKFVFSHKKQKKGPFVVNEKEFKSYYQ